MTYILWFVAGLGLGYHLGLRFLRDQAVEECRTAQLHFIQSQHACDTLSRMYARQLPDITIEIDGSARPFES